MLSLIWLFCCQATLCCQLIRKSESSLDIHDPSLRNTTEKNLSVQIRFMLYYCSPSSTLASIFHSDWRSKFSFVSWTGVNCMQKFLHAAVGLQHNSESHMEFSTSVSDLSCCCFGLSYEWASLSRGVSMHEEACFSTWVARGLVLALLRLGYIFPVLSL